MSKHNNKKIGGNNMEKCCYPDCFNCPFPDCQQSEIVDKTEYMKQYYQKNKEKLQKYQKQYYIKNMEKKKQYFHLYYMNKKEKKMYEQLTINFPGKDYFKITKPVRLIELFAGIGSQAMALRDLGIDFENYFVSEIDKFAIKSYNAIHKTNFNITDISFVSGSDLNICETNKYCYILTYSFPCQDLSPAGKGAGMIKDSGTRSGLLWQVERILNECTELPQILLMENVPQIHNKKNMLEFKKWIDFLNKIGYSNYWQDLNARDYGVAQNRNRCFMISILGKYKYEFPGPFILNKKISDYLEKNVDEKFYIENETTKKFLSKLGNNNINLISNNECKIGNIYGHTGGNYAGNVYSINGLSPVLNTCGGGNRQPLIIASRGRNPENLADRTAGMPTQQHLEPNLNGLCNALTTVQKDNLLLDSNYKIRKLTPLECWRLMGFNDNDFYAARAVNSNTQLYKQAGNSIVKNVLIEIFRGLF